MNIALSHCTAQMTWQGQLQISSRQNRLVLCRDVVARIPNLQLRAVMHVRWLTFCRCQTAE